MKKEILSQMENAPLFEDGERYHKILERAGISSFRGKIDFEERIFDGKLYIGMEIVDYYEEKMKTMTWNEKVAYAAKENGFSRCSIEKYQKITDMKCPNNLECIYMKAQKNDLGDVKSEAYTFLFACNTTAYYYYLTKLTDASGKTVDEDENMFSGNDVFKKLRMMNGKYCHFHKYD